MCKEIKNLSREHVPLFGKFSLPYHVSRLSSQSYATQDEECSGSTQKEQLVNQLSPKYLFSLMQNNLKLLWGAQVALGGYVNKQSRKGSHNVGASWGGRQSIKGVKGCPQYCYRALKEAGESSRKIHQQSQHYSPEHLCVIMALYLPNSLIMDTTGKAEGIPAFFLSWGYTQFR